jgi:hypothetical protein
MKRSLPGLGLITSQSTLFYDDLVLPDISAFGFSIE